VIDQLAPNELPSPELVCRRQAWRDAHPWLHHAITQIGPGARAAADGWRVRIEDELKTTLDFQVKPDGTAAVWCGMSSYDFHHYPTPKELFEGLATAYRLESKRRSGSDQWRMSTGDVTRPGGVKPQTFVRALPRAAKESFARALGAVALLHAEQFVLIFLGITGLTLVLSIVAVTVR
jgi:hypothetical protein